VPPDPVRQLGRPAPAPRAGARLKVEGTRRAHHPHAVDGEALRQY
jgi:hypothetical protein